MVIIGYDISNDKIRTKFSKFLLKFGCRIQNSVFEIENSQRILNNICYEIKNNFEKKFEQTDSVLIFKIPDNCEILRFGYAKNEEKDLLIVK